MSRAAMEAMGWPNGVVLFPDSMQPKRDECGVIGCGCGQLGYMIPPKRDESEPYDERESNP